MVGLWLTGCGEVIGVRIGLGPLLYNVGPWGCEQAEFGLVYMGVDGSVGTVGYIIGGMAEWKEPCRLESDLASVL